MIRWSAASAAATALFWGVWWLATGSVPEVTSVPLWLDAELPLPFAASRWWDILLGPAVSCLAVLGLSKFKGLKWNELEFASFVLSIGLAIGLVCGLAGGLAAGPVFGLVCGLAGGLVTGLVVGLAAGLAGGLVVGLLVGLIIWLEITLAFGLALSLLSGLAGGLPFLALAAATLILPPTLRRLAPALRAVGRWLTGSTHSETALPSSEGHPPDADPRRVRLAELGEEIESKRVEAHELEQQLAEENPDPFRSAPVRQ
jgi:hypothetical protein